MSKSCEIQNNFFFNNRVYVHAHVYDPNLTMIGRLSLIKKKPLNMNLVIVFKNHYLKAVYKFSFVTFFASLYFELRCSIINPKQFITYYKKIIKIHIINTKMFQKSNVVCFKYIIFDNYN